MPPFRRRPPGEPRPPWPTRLPGAGSVSPEPQGHGWPAQPAPQPAPEPPLPEPPAPEPAAGEPRPFEVLGRFAAAARALTFAEQAMQAAQRDGADCYLAGDGSWWVAATLPLGPAREMAGLGGGRLYVATADGFAADRGWGDEPSGQAASLPGRTPVPLLDLVRVAGLHPAPVVPLREACVLVPGHLVRDVVERAQDLGLRATYELVTLDPLFAADRPGAARASYAVWLSAQPAPGPRSPGAVAETLPAALLSALADDPFALVCRPVERALLIRYGHASPLSDGALARLVAVAGDETWLLAPPPDGCARVTQAGAPLDAASLVELGPPHRLLDAGADQAHAEPLGAGGPAPRPLTLVPTTAHRAQVDAVLLDDADLDCLPLLLAGDPLADAALLIRGTARHLVTAPGGLLTELPVGEPLTCVGPGSVYLPLGFRLDPPVGPSARAALFKPDRRIAQVVLRDTRLGYDLETAEPLWRLWAGAVPELDLQLGRQELADLDRAAAQIGDPPRAEDRSRSLIGRLRTRPHPEPEPDPAAWRQEAYQAERAGDYAAAASLYARHNEPLRAARMWEREAREKY
jgi:hypothetical protein